MLIEITRTIYHKTRRFIVYQRVYADGAKRITSKADYEAWVKKNRQSRSGKAAP